jgi:hypothetical protein
MTRSMQCLAKGFVAVGALVLCLPYAGQACVLVALVFALKRCSEIRGRGPGLARLGRLRRHRQIMQDAEIDRLYRAALAKRGLVDTGENRVKVRWIL